MSEGLKTPPSDPVEEANAVLEGTMFQAPAEATPPLPRGRSIANLGGTYGAEWWGAKDGKPRVIGAPAEQSEAPDQAQTPNQETALPDQPDANAAETQPYAGYAEVRYNDIELLGKSFRVRRNINQTANQSVRGVRRLWAGVRNGFSSPGKGVKWLAHKQAESSYQQKERRLKDARDRSASTPLLERRQAAADRAGERLVTRRSSLDRHDERMRGRVETVHERAERHRQGYIDRKKKAVEGKLARQAVHDQLRKEGANRRETKDILAGVPQEHLDRIGRVAIVARATRSQREQAERIHRSAVSALEKNQRDLDGAGKSVEGRNQRVENASEVVANVSSMIESTQDHIRQLQEGFRDLDVDSTEYADLTAEVQNAEERLAAQVKEYNKWQDAIARGNKKTHKAQGRATDLEADRLGYERISARAAQEAEVGEASQALDDFMVEGEVYKALNPKKKTGKAA